MGPSFNCPRRCGRVIEDHQTSSDSINAAILERPHAKDENHDRVVTIAIGPQGQASETITRSSSGSLYGSLECGRLFLLMKEQFTQNRPRTPAGVNRAVVGLSPIREDVQRGIGMDFRI